MFKTQAVILFKYGGSLSDCKNCRVGFVNDCSVEKFMEEGLKQFFKS